MDFAIWLLFSRDKSGERPKNLLCDGFRRDSARRLQAKDSVTKGQIPGLYTVYINHHVRALKQDPWPQLLLLLGQAGERMMIDLLLDCSIFGHVAAGRDNYQQRKERGYRGLHMRQSPVKASPHRPDATWLADICKAAASPGPIDETQPAPPAL